MQECGRKSLHQIGRPVRLNVAGHCSDRHPLLRTPTFVLESDRTAICTAACLPGPRPTHALSNASPVLIAPLNSPDRSIRSIPGRFWHSARAKCYRTPLLAKQKRCSIRSLFSLFSDKTYEIAKGWPFETSIPRLEPQNAFIHSDQMVLLVLLHFPFITVVWSRRASLVSWSFRDLDLPSRVPHRGHLLILLNVRKVLQSRYHCEESERRVQTLCHWHFCTSRSVQHIVTAFDNASLRTLCTTSQHSRKLFNLKELLPALRTGSEATHPFSTRRCRP